MPRTVDGFKGFVMTYAGLDPAKTYILLVLFHLRKPIKLPRFLMTTWSRL